MLNQQAIMIPREMQGAWKITTGRTIEAAGILKMHLCIVLLK